MSDAPAIAEVVQSFLEPIFWATIVAVGLVGCALSQATRWASTSYATDPVWVRIFLVVVIGLNLAKVSCDVLGMRTVLLTDFGRLGAVPATFHAGMVIAVVCIFLCQCWQFHRTLIVSRRNALVTAFGTVLLATSLASSVVFIVGAKRSHNISQTAMILHVWYPITSWLKFATDLFLSGAFALFALAEERKAVNARLGYMLRRVAVTTLQAFFPCTLLALAVAVVGQTSANSTLFGALIIVLAPLYLTSVLYTLNARSAITRAGDRLADHHPGSAFPTEFCSIAVIPPSSGQASFVLVGGDERTRDLDRERGMLSVGRGRKMSLQESLASL